MDALLPAGGIHSTCILAVLVQLLFASNVTYEEFACRPDKETRLKSCDLWILRRTYDNDPIEETRVHKNCRGPDKTILCIEFLFFFHTRDRWLYTEFYEGL